MTETLLKTNGVYGVTIGHRTVFTRQGAIDRYMIVLEVCYGRLNTGSATLLSEVQLDMVNNAGFTWDEVEQMEIEYLESL